MSPEILIVLNFEGADISPFVFLISLQINPTHILFDLSLSIPCFCKGLPMLVFYCCYIVITNKVKDLLCLALNYKKRVTQKLL